MGCGTSKPPKHTQTTVPVIVPVDYAGPAGPVTAKLDFLYGSSTLPGSLHYLANVDVVVYPCASLVVLMTLSSNAQRYLGGGAASRVTGHRGRITALVLNRGRNMLATGETGQRPAICLWNPGSTEEKLTIVLGRESEGVRQMAFSSDSMLLTAIDQVENVLVFELRSGTQVFSAPGKPGKLHSVSWSPKEASFCTAGQAHLAFWTATENSFSRSQHQADLLAVCWTAEGCCTGGRGGLVSLWKAGALSSSHQVLAAECSVQVLVSHENTVLVGGTDRCIHVLDSAFREFRLLETPGTPFSLDACPSGILCATDEGIMLEFGRNGRVVVMDTHASGQIAVALADNSTLVTVAGDNKVKNWNLASHKCVVSGLVEVGLKAQAVSVAIGPQRHVAIGHLDGHLTIRRTVHQLNNVLLAKKESSHELSRLVYSPTGSYLAAISAGAIFLHDPKKGYAVVRTLQGNAIVAADWNVKGDILRTQDESGAVTFWEASSGQHEVREVVDQWASDTLRRAIKSCAARNADEVLAQGTEAGVLELSIPGSPVSAYFGHVGAIRQVVWLGKERLLTVGEDRCILQWQISSTS